MPDIDGGLQIPLVLLVVYWRGSVTRDVPMDSGPYRGVADGGVDGRLDISAFEERGASGGSLSEESESY